VNELLDAEFARLGFEIEDVVVNTRARPPRILVIADSAENASSDVVLDLDAAAELSRLASALLDRIDEDHGHYILEVSSPGVERPLTSDRHLRRARGRKVDLTLADGSALTGRVGPVHDDTLSLVIRSGRDWSVREIPIDRIVEAVVQVEFSPPAKRESELAWQTADQSLDTEAGA
jgi:ribosome maturation factor RimP